MTDRTTLARLDCRAVAVDSGTHLSPTVDLTFFTATRHAPVALPLGAAQLKIAAFRHAPCLQHPGDHAFPPSLTSLIIKRRTTPILNCDKLLTGQHSKRYKSSNSIVIFAKWIFGAIVLREKPVL